MTQITVKELLEPLNSTEKLEVARNDFMEPLKLVLECLNNYKDLTEAQKSYMLDKFRRYARTRVAVKEAVRKNPDILKTPLDNAIVIIGLPRSGTTMLQRLMACDPQMVSPMLWEMLNRVPPGRPKNWRECERYKMAEQQMDIDYWPEKDNLRTLHVMQADLPEECFVILNDYFLEYGLAMFPAMDKFREFTSNTPEEHVRKAYDYYRKCLQCMFYGNLDEGQRLLLKCPMHLVNFDLYREFMPNAKFIFTYRNVSAMIASICSLFAVLNRMVGFPVDNKYLGKMCLEIFKYSSARGISTFKDIPKDSLLCLGYSELIQNPLETVHNIYSHFKLDLPPDVVADMQRHLADNQLNQHGKHLYGSIGDYGITENDIKQAMPEFFEYFKDSTEILL